MIFLPRQAALVVLAVVGVAVALIAFGAPKAVFAGAGWLVFMVLLAAVVFDLYKRPKH